MREVDYYKTAAGDEPVREFLDSLQPKVVQKIVWVLGLIEDLPRIPKQYFKKLSGTDDIWEVRIDFGNDTFRLLGFFDRGNLVILTNGFAKKRDRVPQSEIRIAEDRKSEYLRRKR
jgi:phage-related protein